MEFEFELVNVIVLILYAQSIPHTEY